MMIEAEARQRRCCGPEGCGAPMPEVGRTCIAGECMAWRWLGDGTIRFPDVADGPQRPADVPHDWVWEDGTPGMPGRWVKPRRGYCGLAGRPQ